MKHRGGQLPGNFIHIRQHQQQTLGCRERRRQRPGLQGAVHSSGGAALALHFHNRRNVAPDIVYTLRSPLIGPFGHRR